MTLNHRVPGSSPGAPTIDLERLFPLSRSTIADQLGGQLGDLFSFPTISSLRMALSPSAGSRLR